MRGERIGERFAAFEDTQDVEDDETELRALGDFAGDGEGAVKRNAGVEKSRKFLRKEENIATPSAAKAGELEVNAGFLLADAHVDGNEPLAAEFLRYALVGFGG